MSLNGCYTRITDTFDIAVAPIFNLQGNLNVCGGSGTPLHIPDSLNLGPVNWNLGNPALDNLYSNTLTSGTYTITLWDSLSLCSTDTTFDVTLTNPSTMMGDTTLCTGVMDFQVTGQAGNPAGNWFSASPEISFSNNAVPEPLISATAYGTYTVTYGDICGDTLSADITFASPPTIFPDTSTCSLSFAVSGTDAVSYTHLTLPTICSV